MKIVMRVAMLPLCALIMVVFAGCHKEAPEWLQGAWVYDAPLTEQHLSTAQPGDVNAVLIGQVVGMELTFTSSEVQQVLNGDTTSTACQVVAASSTECTLKLADGTATTYYRTETGIFYNWNSGSDSLKVYLKRKP